MFDYNQHANRGVGPTCQQPGAARAVICYRARILGEEDGTDSGGQTSASTQLLKRTDKWAPHVSECPWWDLGWRELDRVGPKLVPGPRALLYFLPVFLFIFSIFPFLSFRIPFVFQFNSNPCGEFGLRSNMAVEYSSMG
jgi:hypothetical protein